MPRPRPLPSLLSRSSRRAADPQSDTASSTLPEFLDDIVPACSKPCLRDFIADSYPSSTSNDINTLCTTNTTSGFTLGEAALICEGSYCAVDGQVNKSIFSICASVPRSIRPSHDSLTVVPMATSQLTPGSDAFSSALPPTIGAPATTNLVTTQITSATGAPPAASTTSPAPPPPSSTTSPSSSPATPSSNTSLPTPPISSTLSTTTPTSQSSPNVTSSSSPTVSPVASQAQGNLSAGQIVGISLAGLAIFGFVIGLILFLWYRRRERSLDRRGSRWSDVVEKQPPQPFPPGEHHLEAGFSNARAATPDHSQRFYAPPPMAQEKRRSFWRRSIKPEDIGVAVSPEIAHAGSPTSISSQRTTSQLLPELPHYALWPAPLRRSQQNPVAPEHRHQLARPTITFPSTFVESKQTKKRPRIVSSRSGNGLPTDPRAQMHKQEQAKGANNRIPLTPVYDNGNVPTTFGAILASRENAHLHPGYSSHILPQQRKVHPRLQPAIVVEGPPATQTSTLAYPPAAHVQTTRSRQAPPMRRNSSASDTTTFEDDEDTTPEQEHDKQLRPKPLSPVVESPRRISNSPLERLTTPLKDLAYPSPPRSAAISKQAEKQARPRAAQFVDTSATATNDSSSDGPAPTPAPTPSRRDQLVLDERSFFGTASSSSPSTRKRDDSPSSLLAKRRGDKAADRMLEQGLRLSSTAANANAHAHAMNKWQASGAQARDQNAARGRKGSDTENQGTIRVVLKTPPPKSGGGLKSPPVWTPKLTPTRRGEDLYLRVE